MFKKKMTALVLAVMVVCSLFSANVFASSNVSEAPAFEQGTYRVTAAGDNNGYANMGYFFILDEDGEVSEYAITSDSNYGYIYYDGKADIQYSNVNLEKISDEDIGVSNYHVFIWANYRDFDPVLDDAETWEIAWSGDLSDFD